MPPHCDSKDGPVVKAALLAIAAGDVSIILPFVPEPAEEEVTSAFDRVIAARSSGGAAAEVADEWFCETVVRLHRAGEGASYTGLKPAGLGHGPVVPVAEKAVETGEVAELRDLLATALTGELERKFGEVQRLRGADGSSVAQQREYVEAMLGFIVWSHKTYVCVTSDPLHAHGSMHTE